MTFVRFCQPVLRWAALALAAVVPLACSSSTPDGTGASAGTGQTGGGGAGGGASSIPRACDAMTRDIARPVVGEELKPAPGVDSKDASMSMCGWPSATTPGNMLALIIMPRRDPGCSTNKGTPHSDVGQCSAEPCACFFGTNPVAPDMVNFEAYAGPWSLSLNGPRFEEEKLKVAMRAIIANLPK